MSILLAKAKQLAKDLKDIKKEEFVLEISNSEKETASFVEQYKDVEKTTVAIIEMFKLCG